MAALVPGGLVGISAGSPDVLVHKAPVFQPGENSRGGAAEFDYGDEYDTRDMDENGFGDSCEIARQSEVSAWLQGAASLERAKERLTLVTERTRKSRAARRDARAELTAARRTQSSADDRDAMAKVRRTGWRLDEDEAKLSRANQVYLDTRAVESATILDDVCTAPGVPAGLVASSTDAESVTLVWSPVQDAESYTVYVDGFVEGEVSSSQVKITGFTNGTKHYAQVSSGANDLDSRLSPAVEFTPGVTGLTSAPAPKSVTHEAEIAEPVVEPQVTFAPKARAKNKKQDKQNEKPEPGNLRYSVHGLPGRAAKVAIYKPNGRRLFRGTLQRSQSFRGIDAGLYHAMVKPTKHNNKRYHPIARTATISIRGKSTTRARADFVRVADLPNIVVILADDQPKGMMAAMPTVMSEIAAKGQTFNNALLSTSICCSSRASMFTGLLANKNGVYGNVPRDQGGYDAFLSNGNESRTLAVKLADNGYVTGLFGKYMNGYAIRDGMIRPPGWHEFDTFDAAKVSGKYRNYYSTRDASALPVTEQQGQPLKVVGPAGTYSTKTFGELTTSFIRNVPPNRPLFAMFTPYAPHGPYKSESKYRGTALPATALEQDPSLNETDLSKKPTWIQRQTLKPVGDSLDMWRKQTETLRSVDDQVGEIVAALAETNRLKNTLLVYTSDNGIHEGQHNLWRKHTPYRATTEVDLFMRFPGSVRAQVSNAVVSPNVDVVGTALALAGLRNETDGQDVRSSTRAGVPLLASRQTYSDQTDSRSPDYRAPAVRPSYCGWRTPDTMYVRYASGEREFYDYRTDPFELNNRVDDPEVADQVAASAEAAQEACAQGFGPPADYIQP